MISFSIDYIDYKINTPEEMVEEIKRSLKKNLYISIMEQNLDSNFLNRLLSLCHEQGLSNKIKVLSLCDAQLGNEEAMRLADFIRDSSSIRKITLMANNIGDTGAIALAEAIASSPQFNHLCLAHNKISDRGIKAIAQCMATHPSLEVLELDGNKFSAEGFKDIATAVGQNRSLLKLSFFYNRYSDDGLTVLAESLKKHPSIKQLIFNNMQREGDIPHNGWNKLADALKNHSSIKELDVKCHYRDSCAWLFTQPSIPLTTLNLSYSRLTDNEAGDIAANLSKHPTLKKLDIGANNFTDIGLKKIQASLSTNTVLQNIDCRLNRNSSSEAIRDLTETAKSRPALSHHKNQSKLTTNQEPSQAASSSETCPTPTPAEKQPKGKSRRNRSNSTEEQQALQQMDALLSRIETLEKTVSNLQQNSEKQNSTIRHLKNFIQKQNSPQKTSGQSMIHRLITANERLARSNRHLAKELREYQTPRSSEGFFSKRRTARHTPISIVDDSSYKTSSSMI